MPSEKPRKMQTEQLNLELSFILSLKFFKIRFCATSDKQLQHHSHHRQNRRHHHRRRH